MLDIWITGILNQEYSIANNKKETPHAHQAHKRKGYSMCINQPLDSHKAQGFVYKIL